MSGPSGPAGQNCHENVESSAWLHALTTRFMSTNRVLFKR